MNALKYHWCETSLLSQAVLKHVVSKDFIFKKSVKGPVLYSAKNEEIYGIVPHQKFFMSCYITFKKKTLTCGSQVAWVMCGLHLDCFVGQCVKWVNRHDPLSTLIYYKINEYSHQSFTIASYML